MEILTLLRANIKKKKGTVVSIAVLMAIITAVMTAMISVRDNYTQGMEDAFSAAGSGDTLIMIESKALTDELKESLENSSLVEKVEYYDALGVNGISHEESSSQNIMFLSEMRGGIRLFNSSLTGFVEEIPELQKGEIYLPLGLKYNLHCEVGDEVMIRTAADEAEIPFRVKGFVQEPCSGAATIGWKILFISSEDRSTLSDSLNTKFSDIEFDYKLISVSQSGNLSVAKFQRQLNLETKIIDNAKGAITREQSVKYSTLMPDVILDVVTVFTVFLFVIVLIVMSNSIGTEIEIDYTSLGILKAMGFGNGRIRLIFFLQYILAQTAGIIVGLAVSLPIEYSISKACMSITAVLPASGLSVGKSAAYILLIFLCSGAIILFKTHRLVRLSPMRAISGGREAIYFDSRLNVPIAKKQLSATLALRQVTSAKRRYIGCVIITAILTFFMITINLIGGLLTAKGVRAAAMGLELSDFYVIYTDVPDRSYESEIEEIISSHTEITSKNFYKHLYVSMNGESLSCEISKYPENTGGIFKGREPRYDNELIITEMLGDALGLKIGDKVMLSYKNSEAEFIVTGLFQSTNDSGMTYMINFDGANRLGIETDFALGIFSVADRSKIPEIEKEINEKYGEFLSVEALEEDFVIAQYKGIVDLLRAVIYSFSILFAFVVVRMVCAKTFIQERRDIGIFKAVGFSSGRLRLSFAIRFFIAALVGACLGTALSLWLSAKSIGALLSIIGVSRVFVEFTPAAVLVPAAAISASFFLFALLASRRINSVEIKELVTE